MISYYRAQQQYKMQVDGCVLDIGYLTGRSKDDILSEAKKIAEETPYSILNVLQQMRHSAWMARNG